MALLACYQQMEIAGRELALSKSLLDRALQALDSAEEEAELLPKIDRLLTNQLQEIKQSIAGGGAVRREARTGPFPFRMDPGTRVARIGERRIPLTEREYAVLELLWEEMPRPVGRKMLMERLFGTQKPQDGNAADWYIFQVRHKLKNAGCNDAEIRSIRGQGWVLELRGVDPATGRIFEDASATDVD